MRPISGESDGGPSTGAEGQEPLGRQVPRWLTLKVGPLPLPLYLALIAVIFGAAAAGLLPADMIGGFAVIMILGWLLGDVGMKIPVLKDIGGPAMLSLFVPSLLVFYQILNGDAMAAIVALMSKEKANFLYLYIACLVSGSILGMQRRMLVQGFARMFIPLVVGTIAATVAGLGVGLLFGYDPKHTFFYIVIPIMGGGIGEGILPYSLAMAEILHQPQTALIPQLIPAAMLGNIVAIVSAGCLNRFGQMRPQFSGGGLLVRSGAALPQESAKEKPIEFPLMGAGLAIACSFFIFGSLLGKLLGIPGPIVMIFSAAFVKVAAVMPAKMETGAYLMYRFIATNLTWPLLVGLGATLVPWQDLVGALSLAYATICAAVVLAMVASGFLVGRWMRMYEIEAAIVTACHSGLGGTGDVAILSAANRMELMPFAQISTRIGGAIMIVVGTVLLKALT